jgi:hypothetical protein
LGKVAKFSNNPGLEHWKALKHVLRFVKGTLGYGVEFKWLADDQHPDDGPLKLEAWCDSSFADDVDTARTTLGFVIKANGATIMASSKLSTRVDSCVNHSEFRALQEVVGVGQQKMLLMTGRSLEWMRGVKADLEGRDSRKMPPTPVYVDNAGVITMLKGATLKQANKAIHRTWAEVRERVHMDKAVVVVKIGTTDNIANALTKQEHGIAKSAEQLRKIAGPAERWAGFFFSFMVFFFPPLLFLCVIISFLSLLLCDRYARSQGVVSD